MEQPLMLLCIIFTWFGVASCLHLHFPAEEIECRCLPNTHHCHVEVLALSVVSAYSPRIPACITGFRLCCNHESQEPAAHNPIMTDARGNMLVKMPLNYKHRKHFSNQDHKDSEEARVPKKEIEGHGRARLDEGTRGPSLYDMLPSGELETAKTKEDGNSKTGIHNLGHMSELDSETDSSDKSITTAQPVSVKENMGEENMKTENKNIEGKTVMINQTNSKVIDHKNLTEETESNHNQSDKPYSDLQKSSVTQEDSSETNKLQDSLILGMLENPLHADIDKKGSQNRIPERSFNKEEIEEERVQERDYNQGKDMDGETHSGMNTEPNIDIEEGNEMTTNNIRVLYLEDTVDAHKVAEKSEDTATYTRVSQTTAKTLEESHEGSKGQESSAIEGEISGVFIDSKMAPEHSQEVDKLQEQSTRGKAHDEHMDKTKQTVDGSHEASIILQYSQNVNDILGVSQSINTASENYSGTRDDLLEHHDNGTSVSKTFSNSNETIHEFHDLDDLSEDSHNAKKHQIKEMAVGDPLANEDIFGNSHVHEESSLVKEATINHELISTQSLGFRHDQDSDSRVGGIGDSTHGQIDDTALNDPFAFTTPSFPDTLQAPEVGYHTTSMVPPDSTSASPIVLPFTPELHIDDVDGSVPPSGNMMKNEEDQQRFVVQQNNKAFSYSTERETLESLTVPRVHEKTVSSDKQESSSILQESQKDDKTHKTITCHTFPCSTEGTTMATETSSVLYSDTSAVTETINPSPGMDASTPHPPILIPKTLPPLHLNSEEELRNFLLSLENLPKAGTSSDPQGDILLDVKDRNQGKSTSYLSWLWG
ncbi:uncharacterized protein LOC122256061 [Penaeus japonicus]|uniref:uncharacterized protein LOC122256061 n=1 Tax=Penaeus japonicus TaxID=27405 RepID=UPI001C70D2D8|nr:uncharacterized protein LOC122256061 [Penaeus japonicus]